MGSGVWGRTRRGGDSWRARCGAWLRAQLWVVSVARAPRSACRLVACHWRKGTGSAASAIERLRPVWTGLALAISRPADLETMVVEASRPRAALGRSLSSWPLGRHRALARPTAVRRAGRRRGSEQGGDARASADGMSVAVPVVAKVPRTSRPVAPGRLRRRRRGLARELASSGEAPRIVTEEGSDGKGRDADAKRQRRPPTATRGGHRAPSPVPATLKPFLVQRAVARGPGASEARAPGAVRLVEEGRDRLVQVAQHLLLRNARRGASHRKRYASRSARRPCPCRKRRVARGATGRASGRGSGSRRSDTSRRPPSGPGPPGTDPEPVAIAGLVARHSGRQLVVLDVAAADLEGGAPRVEQPRRGRQRGQPAQRAELLAQHPAASGLHEPSEPRRAQRWRNFDQQVHVVSHDLESRISAFSSTQIWRTSSTRRTRAGSLHQASIFGHRSGGMGDRLEERKERMSMNGVKVGREWVAR